ncbi:M20/M25/M40 family metallo-hydrolase [Seonamhaeicola sp.]|uniref:M20/M25/M40 family metallo-hydrolase n=1 Tax=Seonamhaeicola sp. TaxID=1912245 RepID=UPI0026139D2D|nr:M20/M25/M40 family metallo-hydrolase [Seonamhaeicola sp.]
MKQYNINNLTEHAVDLLKRLIKAPSYSGKEEMAAKLIKNDLESNGVRFLEKGNNTWTYVAKSDKPKILLNSHIDTVFPCSGWQQSPFAAVEEDGKIIGLGANDAGGALVSLLMAYYTLKDMDLDFDLIFSATAEEEITGAMGIESILPLLGNVDLAIVGEPTSMKLATGEKGLMVFDIKSEGEVCHAAHFQGQNAIDHAIADIQKLKQINFGDQHAKMGATKLSVTQILAGKQHNVTPEECCMVVDVRTNELISNKKILKIVQKELESKVTARSTRLNASFIDKKHPIVQIANDLEIECFISNTISDQAVIPFPSVKIGPGDSLRSHTADEFIYIDEIKHGIETYIKILSKLKL